MMDATFLAPDGDIVTKYKWSSPTAEVPVYGLHNGKQGIWMIQGGSDYLNGGPSKQHNTCHATEAGPILLNILYSNHYGSRGSFVSGKWKKIFGPTFVYLNQADDGEDLWEDAKRKEEKLSADWPYKWIRHPENSVKRSVCPDASRILTMVGWYWRDLLKAVVWIGNGRAVTATLPALRLRPMVHSS